MPVANARAPSGASSTAAMPATISTVLTSARLKQLRAGEHLERRREGGQRGWPRTRRRDATRISAGGAQRSASAMATSDTSTPARAIGEGHAERLVGLVEGAR